VKRLVLPLVLTALLAACGPGDDGRVLTVFAAASLTEPFTVLEQRFEAGHPDVDVRVNMAGSAQLATQIVEGAPADVFASADEANMAKVVGEGRIDGQPKVFATNVLTIAVPPGNPAGITGLADLTRDGLVVVVCAPEVPCGAATERVEQRAGVTLRPESEEQDVKSVLNKVRTGVADAGLVYVTDVASAGEAVDGVGFPEADEAVNRYPIAVVTGSQHSALARDFADFVSGGPGRQELGKVGFGTP
jgi:molybdate transport system substrate-binding protein